MTHSTGRLSRWLVVCLLLLSPGLAGAEDRFPQKVLAAFQDVVAAPANSTVQIYCDGESAALGTIVDPAGYIVTKASELDGKITCQLNRVGGKRYEATVVGRDKELDLAVLKIDAPDLVPIAWSEGDAPPVGSWLVTPGLSQVPLAIGVLSVSPRRISAPPGALGIELFNPEKPAITAVQTNSPAEKAGLKAGDVVLKVNGKAVADRRELIETIQGYQAGESVELRIKRGDMELTKTAVLGSFAKLFDHNGDDRAEFQNNLGGQLSERRTGFPSVIQHDSVLTPKQCGGPIVDLDGKAVGINIARAGRVESFALPGSVVRAAVKKLLETQQTSTSVER